MPLYSFCDTKIILIWKPEKDKKENYRLISHEHKCKNIKISPDQIQWYIYKKNQYTIDLFNNTRLIYTFTNQCNSQKGRNHLNWCKITASDTI